MEKKSIDGNENYPTMDRESGLNASIITDTFPRNLLDSAFTDTIPSNLQDDDYMRKMIELSLGQNNFEKIPQTPVGPQLRPVGTQLRPIGTQLRPVGSQLRPPVPQLRPPVPQPFPLGFKPQPRPPAPISIVRQSATTAVANPITKEYLRKFTLDDYKNILDLGKEKKTTEIKNLIYRKMNIIDEKTKYNLDNIKKFNEEYSPDEININKYDSYYICSDLHADLMSFFATFLKSGIIRIKGLDTDSVINDLSKDNYGGKNILIDYLCKYEIELSAPEKTCILILGDVVDGNRPMSLLKSISVYNPDGLNEILIHMILYNMRLDAILKNSYVKVLIGNHDMDAILMQTNLLGRYIDIETSNLFSSKFTDRKEILFPFYSIDSSIYEIIYKDTKGTKEIYGLMSHGSFTEDQNLFTNIIPVIFSKKIEVKKYILNLLENQKSIPFVNHPTKNFDGIIDIDKKDIVSLIYSIIWSRHIPTLYATYGRCVDHSYISDNTTLIMGHCPTNLYGSYPDNWTGYEKCGHLPGAEKDLKHVNPENIGLKSCVNINCVENKIPKIILVDNALSNALSKIEEKKLPNFTELLLIRHKNQELNYYTLRLPFNLPLNQIIIYKTDVNTNTMYPARVPIPQEEQRIVLTGGKIKKYIYKINNVSKNSQKYNLYSNKLNYYTLKNKKYLNFIN